ncbi:MAG TPA: phospholipase A [Halothiobacillus sp.]|nr:phospholipase A [Halothiobacillus sp.]
MTRMNLMASILLLPLGGYSTSALAADGRLAQCKALLANDARLACYDRLAQSIEDAPAKSEQIVSPIALRPTAPPPSNPATTASAPPEAVKNNALAHRLAEESQKNDNPFLIRALKPNYILFATYTPTNLNRPVYDFTPQHVEAKYQLSFQFDWWDRPLGKNTAFYFGYTQLSFWQLYNSEFLNSSASAPFRETDYEPEIGLDLSTKYHLAGLDFRKFRFSFIHQSNGQGGARSRSWNRLALQTAFGTGNFAGVARAWYRIPEARATDDNPDITDYLGYGDLTFAYKLQDGTLSATLRNNLKRQNRGSIEINYSRPINKHIRAYVQYFNGYGESLIDYNRSISRFGIGLALTDWL